MPPNNHAARLREMGEEEKYLVAEMMHERHVRQRHQRTYAALLAGAEALEACAKLRAFADELTAQNMPVLHGMAYQLDRLLPQEANR